MGIKIFTKLILETLNPNRYKGLTQRSIAKTLLFFVSISLLYLIILGAVNTPRYYSNYVAENMSGLDEFRININIETNKPIVLSESPRIILDTSLNGTLLPKADAVITKGTIYSKVLFWTKKTDYSEYDILSNINSLKRNAILLILVFIPSILVISYLFILTKYLLIILLFSLLALIPVFLTKNRITLREVFKSAVYAITIYYTANIISSLFRIRYLGIIIYIIFFAASLFFMKDDVMSSHDEEE